MRTERGLDRLVTFLDAVVAIAITLLVLPLIEVLTEDSGEDLGTVLSDNLGQFGAFALSFVVIARLWLAHHRIVESVGAYDGLFLWVNLFWAFTIVLLPFATAVIAEFGTDRLSLGLYVGTIAASSGAATTLTLLLRRRPGLRRRGVGADDVEVVPSVVVTGLLLVALVLGVVFPRVNFYAMFVLFLSGPVEQLVQRVRVRG
ncbi:TMEM175 family protein [Modestobacter altitudinis]|uniref:TMEM175 family protein n=1 Tax=Modestobacter altitudinis TaxID=2213158 RepID=UPI00110CA6CE|nr:TMEM175 family protein [Modestobacter altitudinis]